MVSFTVWGLSPVKVDVRVIAATHQNLEARVKEQLFREDLFHRLNVIPINLPRLADRREDIPALAEFFLQKAAKQLGVEKNIARRHLYFPDQTALARQRSTTGKFLQLDYRDGIKPRYFYH